MEYYLLVGIAFLTGYFLGGSFTLRNCNRELRELRAEYTRMAHEVDQWKMRTAGLPSNTPSGSASLYTLPTPNQEQ